MKSLKPLKTLHFQSNRRGSIPLRAADCFYKQPNPGNAGNLDIAWFPVFLFCQKRENGKC